MEDSALSSILAGFQKTTGIVFSSDRLAEVEASVRRAMSEAKISETNLFDNGLAWSRLLEKLVDHLTVRETYFFRDNGQFEEIARRVLPAWRIGHSDDAVLHAWSVGCASGEEAYSMAMMLEREKIPARVLGTDIARQALRKAEQGTYGQWSLRGEGRRALAFCDATEPPFSIPDRLRAKIEFRYLNLAADGYPSPSAGIADFDLILCRNVLIYFDDATVRRTAERLAESLAPNGWLVTGPSDPPLWDHIPLEPVVTPAGVFYCRRPRAAAPRRTTKVSRTAARAVSDKKVTAFARPVRAPAKAPPAPDVPKGLAEAPATAESNYAQAIALFAAGRYREAQQALRRLLYLDPSVAVAHFLMALTFERLGDIQSASRAYGRADVLCSARPPDDIVAYSDGETAEQLAAAARSNVVRLQMMKDRRHG